MESITGAWGAGRAYLFRGLELTHANAAFLGLHLRGVGVPEHPLPAAEEDVTGRRVLPHTEQARGGGGGGPETPISHSPRVRRVTTVAPVPPKKKARPTTLSVAVP